MIKLILDESTQKIIQTKIVSLIAFKFYFLMLKYASQLTKGQEKEEEEKKLFCGNPS